MTFIANILPVQKAYYASDLVQILLPEFEVPITHLFSIIFKEVQVLVISGRGNFESV